MSETKLISDDFFSTGYKSVDDPDIDAMELTKLHDSQHSKDERNDEDGKAKREMWASPMEFLLSCIGYAVGLGNLWRFPYLCMIYGGGAFLIPYFVCLFILGMPLFFLEMIMGQYTSSSCINMWNISPIFKGIGWSMMLVSSLATIYYNTIMAWVLFYLFHSFSSVLPWATCKNEWNKGTCFSYYEAIQLNGNTSFSLSNVKNGSRILTSAEEFWFYKALDITDSINELGGIRWELVGCFALSWTLVYLCLFRGIKSSGKVVYVTAVAPYIFIGIIIVRGALLPGSLRGVLFYLTPNWSVLTDIKIWSAASVQIFYALGPGWGGIITFGSYNPFNYNCLRASIIIPIICCLSSFYSGFAIFTVIGHMAHVLNASDVNTVVQAGPGLAFVAYPEALTQLPGSAIWSVLFFIMLITLGLDSQFATLETAITGLSDEFPRVVGKYKKYFTFLFVLLELSAGLIFTTRGGIYYFQIVDNYLASYSIVFIVILELIALGFIFNISKVLECAEQMMGPMNRAVKLWWSITWTITSPICLQLVIVSVVMGSSEPNFPGKIYPRWAIVFGWIVASLPIIPIPIYAVHVMMREGLQNWKAWFLPNEKFRKIALSRVSATSECAASSLCVGSQSMLRDSEVEIVTHI